MHGVVQVTQADLDAGSVTNVASASAGGTTSNTDTQTAVGEQSTGLLVEKSADGVELRCGG